MQGLFKRARLSYHQPCRPRCGLYADTSRCIATPAFELSEEVEWAVANNHPIVALESAIITHGMPDAHRVQLGCEAIVRENAAIPATIGIIKGKIKVGLSPGDIEHLAQPARERDKWKVGRRELAAAKVMAIDGGTTVSATSAIAHRAGIKVFATGGIGGVHRGAETSFDISSDLTELGKTPIAVVCAGAKSILDIGRTLEYLETQGVTVLTYGEEDDFPAFYTRQSGHRSGLSLNTPEAVADLISRCLMIFTVYDALADWNHVLRLDSGILVAVPIPAEHAADGELIQKAIDQAIHESEENGIARRGNEVTPWLLNRVKQLTGGRSLKSNIALVQNNASVAAKIARAYSGASDKQPAPSGKHQPAFQAPQETLSKPVDICVIGSAAFDVTARAHMDVAVTTSPGSISLTPGGVARNIAEASHRLGAKETTLIAAIGDDAFGKALRSSIVSEGIPDHGLLTVSGQPTAVCNNLLSAQGDLVGGVADMGIAESLSTSEVAPCLRRANPKLVAFDGNILPSVMTDVLIHCQERRTTSFFEPTSNVKATRLIEAILRSTEPVTVSHAAPNVFELKAMWQAASDLFERPEWFRNLDSYRVGTETRNAMDRRLPAALLEQGLPQMALSLLPFISNLWVKLGPLGLVFVGLRPASTLQAEDGALGVINNTAQPGISVLLRHFPALPLPEDAPVTATGAGDSLAAAICVALTAGETNIGRICTAAQRAAVMTLQSSLAVSPLLSPEVFRESSTV